MPKSDGVLTTKNLIKNGIMLKFFKKKKKKKKKIPCRYLLFLLL